MHERGRLESLPRRFICQTARGELAQFIINERHQILRSTAVAAADGVEDAGGVGHSLVLSSQGSGFKTDFQLNVPHRFSSQTCRAVMNRAKSLDATVTGFAPGGHARLAAMGRMFRNGTESGKLTKTESDSLHREMAALHQRLWTRTRNAAEAPAKS